MEKFRISNDLSIFWSITEKDGSPYNLSDKTVRLIVTHPRGRMDVTSDITVQGNVICWLFRGSKQRFLGNYKITAEIQSSPADRVIKKDIPEAFALVSSSQYEQTEVGRPDINETGNLRLATSLDIFQIQPIVPQIGPNGNWWVDGVDTGKSSVGLTAYEFAKENGYEGTEEEYAAECLAVPVLNEESRIATAAALKATEQSIAQQESVNNYMNNVAEPTIARATKAASDAEQVAADIRSEADAVLEDVDAAIASVNQTAESANAAAASANAAAASANVAAEKANEAAGKVEEAIEAFGPHNIGSIDLFEQIIAQKQNYDLTLEDKEAILNGKIITASVGEGVVPTIGITSIEGLGLMLMFHFNERIYSMCVMWNDDRCYINGFFSFSRHAKFFADTELSETSENAVQNKVVTEKLAELSENLDKIDSDAIHITDAYGNIILTIDADGIKTTDVEIKSGKISEVIAAITEGLAAKLGKEIDSDFFQVQDVNGNIAFRIDSEGVHTPKSDSWIVSMILGETYIPTSTQRDENGDVQSAEIVYPDGNKGNITITSRENNGVTAMAIGYKDRVVSVTMERDSHGNVNKINIA